MVKPFTEEIPLYPDGSGDEEVVEAAAADPSSAKNSNLLGDAPADGVSTEDVPGPGVSDADMGHEDDAELDKNLLASGLWRRCR